MKGILNKTEQGWVINYNYSVNKNDWETLPLHPEFIEMMDTCFTSKFTRDVEFEIVTEWENGEVGVNGLTYAKLINNVPDTMKIESDTYAWESPFDFICQDPDCPHCIEEINQMQDDDDLEDDVEKLVKEMNKQPMTFVPNEISDEEIEKAANNPINDGYSFIEGAKWYREQLKQR